MRWRVGCESVGRALCGWAGMGGFRTTLRASFGESPPQSLRDSSPSGGAIWELELAEAEGECVGPLLWRGWEPPPCMFALARELLVSELNRGAADRCPLGREGRDRAWVAAPRPRVEPEQLPGPTKPASCKDGPVKDRSVRCSGNRPTWGSMWPRRCSTWRCARRASAGVAHDAAGLEQLVARLQALAPASALIVLEATGGLELELVGALALAALPVVVVNPRQVRDFARATGTLAKTDALDAALLAHFAEAVRPPLRALRDAETQPGAQGAAGPQTTAGRRCWSPSATVAAPPALRFARGSRPTSRGWSKSAASWRTSSARRCSGVPSGVSVTSCCAACRAWASSSR